MGTHALARTGSKAELNTSPWERRLRFPRFLLEVCDNPVVGLSGELRGTFHVLGETLDVIIDAHEFVA